MAFRNVLAVFLIVFACGAWAQAPAVKPESPAANFRDDELLRRAMIEILRMQRHEIDLITEALATCKVTGRSWDDPKTLPCRIAVERYYVAYNDGRAIDRILFALQMAETEIRILDRLPKDDPKRRKMGDDIRRSVDISFKLGEAVSTRNRELARALSPN
jgi:hypothetical protein